MNRFLDSLYNYPRDKKVIVEFVNGRRVLGMFDTWYETDNGLEIDEEGYIEYWAAAIKIIAILIDSLQKDDHIKIGNLFEVSDQGDIKTIWSEDGQLLWEL